MLFRSTARAVRAALPLIAFALAAASAGCNRSALAPLPFQITLEASTTSAAPGQTISFVITAQGSGLLGVEISYGDDAGDSFNTGGSRTAKLTFPHAYAGTGTYTVTVTVADGVEGTKTATTQVQVK